MKLMALIAAAIVATVVYGAAPEQTERTLALNDAIQIALEHNAALLKSGNLTATGRLDYLRAKMAFLPDLSGTASSSASDSRYYNSAEDKTGSHSSRNLSASLHSSINLFNGFADAANLERARLAAAAGDFSYDYARQTLIHQIVAQYVDVIVKDEDVGIARENLAAQQQLLDRVNAMYQAGNQSVTDVLRQKADIAQAELKLLSAEQDFKNSKIQLNEVFGNDFGGEFSVQSPPIDSLLPQIGGWADSLAAKSDLRRKADLQAQSALVAASQQDLRASRGGYLPTLSASLNYGSSYSDDVVPTDFSRQFFDARPSLSAGVTLSVPIFDRGVTRTGVEKSQLQLKNEELTLRDLQLTAGLELKSALLDFTTAFKQRSSAAAQLDFAKQSQEAVQARYEVGAATYTDLSQSRAQFVQASGDLVSANWNIVIKFFDVAYQTGDVDNAVRLIAAGGK